MLTAVVLHLRPVAEARLPVSHGSFIHAAALQLFLRLDPLLSYTIHQQEGRKPFTCSPLMGTDRREGFELLLSPQQLYTWRLTGLTPHVSQNLHEAAALPSRLGGINIKEAVLTIERVSTTPEQHPEARQDTYKALLARWAREKPPRKVTLHFLTPTTFRIGNLEQPFPLPQWVFGSLLRIWNAFAPQPFPEDLQDDFEKSVTLSNFKGETKLVELGDYSTAGFVGKFTYRAAKPAPEVSQLLGLLAEFAFYAGVGWQTTHGLGQVRPQWLT